MIRFISITLGMFWLGCGMPVADDDDDNGFKFSTGADRPSEGSDVDDDGGGGGAGSGGGDADADSDADSDADADADSDSDSDADADGDPSSDNDGDGWSNAEEEEAGTNPNYVYSHPYSGGYNVGWCGSAPSPTGPSGTGYGDVDAYATGDVVGNFGLMDQHGEEVNLYSFCDKHVMIDISAGWCAPCRSLASEMQSLQDAYRADGLQVIVLISSDNDGAFPSQAFLQSWADDYGFDDIPVLGLTNPTTYDDPYFLFEIDGYIPTLWQIGDDMKVLSADNGVHNPSPWL